MANESIYEVGKSIYNYLLVKLILINIYLQFVWCRFKNIWVFCEFSTPVNKFILQSMKAFENLKTKFTII